MTDFGAAATARLMEAYAVWIAGMIAVVMWRATVQHRRLRRVAPSLPGLREALITYLSGNEDIEPLRHLHRLDSRQMGDAVMTFEGAVAGAARDRLCDLTIELALVHGWAEDTRSRDARRRRAAYSRLAFVCAYEPCRRIVGDTLMEALEDPDPEIRVASARALLHAGNPSEIEVVFALTLSQDLLVRVLLAEELRRHAVMLCQQAIPESLKSDDPAMLTATLDMLLAWERALPLTGLARLLAHRDRGIRLRALRLAPLVAPERDTQAEVIRGLAEPDPEICRAAARTAGRMRLDQALPLLARCLRQGTPEVARDAAFALTQIHPAGIETLEELSASDNLATAAAATEALAHMRSQAGLQ